VQIPEKAAEPSIEAGTGPEEQISATPFCDLTDAQLEQIVEKGKATYLEVGAALDEIHRRKKYKKQYGTFKRYLEQRWGISRAHGYRLIAAHRIAETSPVGDKPKNEHQARQAKKCTNKPKGQKPEGAPTISNLDRNEEFNRFESLLTDWESKFEKPDYLWLLERVNQHVGGCLSVDTEVAP